MTEPFHDFDPYAALEQMSQLMREISQAHNNLVNDYVQVKARTQQLEHRIRRLELDHQRQNK
jgi:phage shock protein A